VPEPEDESEVREGDGEGTPEISLSRSERGGSLIPRIMWAGERVGWIWAPA
jgi:hypothetical protein